VKTFLTVPVSINDKYREMNKMANSSFFILILKRKILNPLADHQKVPSYTVELSILHFISVDYPFK
jgi:hypothetical protein